jgi:hypothetical protein
MYLQAGAQPERIQQMESTLSQIDRWDRRFSLISHSSLLSPSLFLSFSSFFSPYIVIIYSFYFLSVFLCSMFITCCT